MENLRKQYTLDGLDEDDLLECPFSQFDAWFEQARGLVQDKSFEPNAMALATSNGRGEVTNRIVLLKGFDKNGFRFYTNYQSRKGLDLDENPQAALLFFWPQMERQIRINGTVVRTSRELSKNYFDSRPRESRISARVSPQSRPVADRAFLEDLSTRESQRLADQEIPLPENWGGFCLAPTEFEFWQGRQSRLHDRLQYLKNGKEWQIRRLGP